MGDDRETYETLLINHLQRAHSRETVQEAQEPCDICEVYGNLIDTYRT